MKYIELKNKLKDYIIFSQKEIKKLDPAFNRFNLGEWQKKKYIKKITKGYYIFSDLKINEPILFIIANNIYKPSYISFEMALSYYGLIPESIYGITSATTLHTYTFNTEIAPFLYKRIKPKLFFGYKLIRFDDHVIKIADIEKAIIDFFYIKSDIKNENDFEELRINKNNLLEQVNYKKLNDYLDRVNVKALSRRVKRFMRYIKNA